MSSYRHITSTTDDGVMSAHPIELRAVVVGTAAATQTLSLHDVATEGGAAAGNLVTKIDLGSIGDYQYGTGIRFRVGMVAVLSGGSPDITLAVN